MNERKRKSGCILVTSTAAAPWHSFAASMGNTETERILSRHLARWMLPSACAPSREALWLWPPPNQPELSPSFVEGRLHWARVTREHRNIRHPCLRLRSAASQRQRPSPGFQAAHSAWCQNQAHQHQLQHGSRTQCCRES